MMSLYSVVVTVPITEITCIFKLLPKFEFWDKFKNRKSPRALTLLVHQNLGQNF